MLLALLVGLAAGAFEFALGGEIRETALRLAQIIGGLWLNALKMTVIPLIVALLVTGIAAGAEAARGGGIAARSVILFALVYLASAILGWAGMEIFLDAFPLPASAGESLRAGLVAVDPAAASAPVPKVSDFFSGVIPPNVFASAVNNEILQLVIFTVILGLAITRIEAERRRTLVGFFEALAQALLIVIGWVLWLAPLGVFALAFALGAGAGETAFAALLHYIVLVTLLGVLVLVGAYLLAIFGAGLPFIRFAKAMLATQAFAFSTRSSLACLPAMVRSAGVLGIRERVTDICLPLAVALFRSTGPAMNIGVAVYVAHWMGVEPDAGHVIAAVLVAAVISYGSISIPGEVSFISSTAPIAMALGVPIAPLALLVAVEMIPDIMRTVGNVTMDVAVTGTVDRMTGGQRPAIARTRSE
ncbi:MAG TPA: cation:dicarboxylase symporter family transporter [Sphingomicrobium sp.]|nr:cation:dicarboxylase symporter family transporter [Sphingomicrobium sp.]